MPNDPLFKSTPIQQSNVDDVKIIATDDAHSVSNREHFQSLLENLKTQNSLIRSNSNDIASVNQKATPQNCKVQKQISLYEKDATSPDYKKLTEDLNCFTRSPSKMKIKKRWIGTTDNTDGGGGTTSFASADNLQITDTDKTDCSSSSNSVAKAIETKTKSCMNLKSCISNPGAVLVKEKFIEPPLRVAKSFHGNTSFVSKYKCKKTKTMELDRSSMSTDSVFNSVDSVRNRFTATKVNELDIQVSTKMDDDEDEK